MTLTRTAHPDLPREIVDVPDAFFEVGPIPLPELSGDFRMERIENDSPNIAHVAGWMNRPHLAQAWEFPNPEEWWARRIAAQNAGDYSVPVMLSVKGVPTAYFELYRPGRDAIGATYEPLPHDLGVHVGFGDANDTGKGTASLILAVALAELAKIAPECQRIVFDPDHRNLHARRAAKKLGASDCGLHTVNDRTFNLLIVTREANDQADAAIDEPLPL